MANIEAILQDFERKLTSMSDNERVEYLRSKGMKCELRRASMPCRTCNPIKRATKRVRRVSL